MAKKYTNQKKKKCIIDYNLNWLSNTCKLTCRCFRFYLIYLYLFFPSFFFGRNNKNIDNLILDFGLSCL